MVTREWLVRQYPLALRHRAARPVVRGAAVALGRRGCCELFANPHLDATARTAGGESSGNAAHDDALALLAPRGLGPAPTDRVAAARPAYVARDPRAGG